MQSFWYAGTWYCSMELLLRPKLCRYKILYNPSITELMNAVGGWLEGAVKEKYFQNQLSEPRKATADFMAHETAAHANVKVFKAYLTKQSTDITCLTTD